VAADANHLARAHEGRIRVLHRLGKFGLGQILSRLAAAYTDVLLRLPLTDVTGGLRGCRRAALASLDLSQTRAPAGS
jgi:hypothetical protein